MKIRIGTRRSLLAVTQCNAFARLLKAKHPHLDIELVGIETEGDRIQDVPLQQVEGKDFFVKELDRELLAGRVDLSVHSLKDLSLSRPEGIALACIPPREDPRDVVFFSDGVLEALHSGRPLRIGSSSPRRAQNVLPFLKQSLPRLQDSPPEVEWVPIRGNVPTRLARVSSDLDGVVLAVAGVERLYADEGSRATLTPLIEGLKVQVLPVSLNPTSPGQGALAVECRSDHTALRSILQELHDEQAAALVQIERAALAQWGGGCHQAFGATAVVSQNKEPWLRLLGKSDQGRTLDSWIPHFELPPPLPNARVFDGLNDRAAWTTLETPEVPPLLEDAILWCTHSRAMPLEWKDNLNLRSDVSVWTAGTRSWFDLAEKGFWISGCADSLGADDERQVPRFLQAKNSLYLTHDQSHRRDKSYATYRTFWSEPTEEGIADVRSCSIFFWTSPSQYQQWEAHLPQNGPIQHCCGSGRTAQYLKLKGIEPIVFPSRNAWKGWFGQNDA